MAVSQRGMSIQSMYRLYRDGQLIVNRRYQRKLVWTLAEKRRLIDSILRAYPLPLFLLAEKPPSREGQPAQLEIIDGMQRLNAIFSFIEHGFTIDQCCFDVNEFATARQAAEGGRFTQLVGEVPRLPPKECASILDYQLAVTVFPGEVEERITDVFGRINSGGKRLSNQERRQAGVLSPFAALVRTLAAEIRGDVSRETLLLSEMPEISIETTRDSHHYALRAEDIFWCYQGILRPSDLRESEDEQVLADICASILYEQPVDASGEYLDRLYSSDRSEYADVNRRLEAFGVDALSFQVKAVFSAIRSAIDSQSHDRFCFRNTIYPKVTSNPLKSPFFAVFMAFYDLMFRENRAPLPGAKILRALENLTTRIQVGQKYVKSADRKNNIKVVKGLIDDEFSQTSSPALTHGPGLIFDFENSIRRSRTETPRYEFKQGILRLDADRSRDQALVAALVQTICAIANVGPDADGFLYVGIADKPADAARIGEIDGISPAPFDHVSVVGIGREASLMELTVDKYVQALVDAIAASALSERLKTQVLASIDTISYKGLDVVRVRIPKQDSPSFVGNDCYIRQGAATRKATGPEIASTSRMFPRAAERAG